MSHVAGKRRATTEPQPGRHVLVVDDEPVVASLISDVTLLLGHTTEIAFTGEDALELVRRSRPDVVLLDIKLPGIGGDEVLDRLRREFPDLPVVMITGNQDEALARAMLQRGAMDYLAKPFSIEVLRRILDAACF